MTKKKSGTTTDWEGKDKSNQYTREMRERLRANGWKNRASLYSSEETNRGLKVLAALDGQSVVATLAYLVEEAVEEKIKRLGIEI